MINQYDVPIYPSHAYPIYEETAQRERVKLKEVTWTLGAKPCKTLRKAAGCWTEVTR